MSNQRFSFNEPLRIANELPVEWWKSGIIKPYSRPFSSLALLQLPYLVLPNTSETKEARMLRMGVNTLNFHAADVLKTSLLSNTIGVGIGRTFELAGWPVILSWPLATAIDFGINAYQSQRLYGRLENIVSMYEYEIQIRDDFIRLLLSRMDNLDSGLVMPEEAEWEIETSPTKLAGSKSDNIFLPQPEFVTDFSTLGNWRMPSRVEEKPTIWARSVEDLGEKVTDFWHKVASEVSWFFRDKSHTPVLTQEMINYLAKNGYL